MSPPGTMCLDILSPPPGESEVTSHFERDSSNETNIAARSTRIAAGALVLLACILTSR